MSSKWFGYRAKHRLGDALLTPVAVLTVDALDKRMRRERPFAPARTDRDARILGAMGDIVWFNDLRATDVASAGGKGANLGELTHAEFPVPPGFVVTAQAYLQAMDDAGVRSELAELAAGVDPDDAAALAATSDRLQELVRKAGVPDGAARAHPRGVRAARKRPGRRTFFRNERGHRGRVVRGHEPDVHERHGRRATPLARCRLLGLALRCARRLLSALTRRSPTSPRSRSSSKPWLRPNAVASCSPSIRRPTTRATSSSRVRSGSARWSSAVRSNRTHTSWPSRARASSTSGSGHRPTRSSAIPPTATGASPSPPAEGGRRVLADDEVLALAELGMRVEAHYERPQDVEWAIADGKTYLVQSRPITTLHARRRPRRPRPKDKCCSTGSARLRTRRAAPCECCSRPRTRAPS